MSSTVRSEKLHTTISRPSDPELRSSVPNLKKLKFFLESKKFNKALISEYTCAASSVLLIDADNVLRLSNSGITSSIPGVDVRNLAQNAFICDVDVSRVSLAINARYLLRNCFGQYFYDLVLRRREDLTNPCEVLVNVGVNFLQLFQLGKFNFFVKFFRLFNNNE